MAACMGAVWVLRPPATVHTGAPKNHLLVRMTVWALFMTVIPVIDTGGDLSSSFGYTMKYKTL